MVAQPPSLGCPSFAWATPQGQHVPLGSLQTPIALDGRDGHLPAARRCRQVPFQQHTGTEGG